MVAALSLSHPQSLFTFSLHVQESLNKLSPVSNFIFLKFFPTHAYKFSQFTLVHQARENPKKRKSTHKSHSSC